MISLDSIRDKVAAGERLSFDDGLYLYQPEVSLHEIGASGFWAMMIFLAILVVGFAYEWKKGALDWE